MNEPKPSVFQVVDRNGARGTLDLTVVPPQGSDSRLILVRFDDGSQVFADASALTEREAGMFEFSGNFAELLTQNQSAMYSSTPFGDGGQIVIPLLAEELKIARQKILTGGVRVHKTVTEHIETVDEPILREQLQVERVTVNQFITEQPPVRYEGDVMIVPLLEEVLVVEKRLVLREEVRISKKSDMIREPQQVVVRSEQATLEQIKPEAEQINEKGGVQAAAANE